MRGAASLHLINKLISGFLLTRLMRGAAFFGDIYVENISTFLLTRLMRGAATGPKALNSLLIFLLTRLMRGAAYPQLLQYGTLEISTHAPHARRGV